MTEKEMIQFLKNYILNKCGIMDRSTKEILHPGTMKFGLNDIKRHHQEFTAKEIGELFDQAISELVKNNDIFKYTNIFIIFIGS